MLICLLRAVPLAIAITILLEWSLTPLKRRFHAWRYACGSHCDVLHQPLPLFRERSAD